MQMLNGHIHYDRNGCNLGVRGVVGGAFISSRGVQLFFKWACWQYTVLYKDIILSI